MAKGHSSKSLDNLLDLLVEKGCTIQKVNSVTVKIFAPDGKNKYTCHKSEQGYHPVRRWANKFVFASNEKIIG